MHIGSRICRKGRKEERWWEATPNSNPYKTLRNTARYLSLRTSSGELKAALKGKGQGLRRPSQHSLRTNYKALSTECLWPQACMSTAQLLAPLRAVCCGTSKLTLTHHWQTAPGREVLSVLGSSVPQTKTREFSTGCVVQPGALTGKPHGCGEWPALTLHI